VVRHTKPSGEGNQAREHSTPSRPNTSPVSQRVADGEEDAIVLGNKASSQDPQDKKTIQAG